MTAGLPRGNRAVSLAIQGGAEPRQLLEQLFRELAFHPGRRVYVKPNLSGRAPVIPGENTSVAVMDNLIEALHARGCEEVVIGHGALLCTRENRVPFSETLRASGFDKYARMEGVTLLNLDDLSRTRVQVEGMTLHLPLAFLEEVDTYINLAKVKSHMETGVSLSLKNQMGLPAPLDRARMHATDLELLIAQLGLYCRPHLNLVEGLPAMEGDGPHHGIPRDLGWIAAGTDMVAVDTLVCALLGIPLETVRHLGHAVDLGVGRPVVPADVRQYRAFAVPDFRPAGKVHRFGRRVSAYPTYACSRCIFVVQAAGRRIKGHPVANRRLLAKALVGDNKGVVFGRVDGQPVDESAKLLCIGSCAKPFADDRSLPCLDRCPPRIDEVLDFFREHL